MQTTITARHCEISDALKERARSVVERLGSIASRPIESAVVFDMEGQVADGGAPAARGQRRSCSSPMARRADHRSALDRAEEKLRRQLEKGSTRPRRTANPAVARRSDAAAARFSLPPGRSAPARGAHRRPRARPADARGRSGEPGSRAGRVHRPLRAQPDSRARRDRDHVSQLALARAAAGGAREVLQLRSAVHLRHQGAGGAARAARPRPQRAACRCCAPSSRRRSSTGGSSRSSRRRSRRAPRCTARSPTSTASGCSSWAARESARASACSTSWSGATASWPTTWCR